MMSVVEFHQQPQQPMSAAEYDKERKRIKELYGDSHIEACARWEQELVSLFIRSGWTQEELASRENKSQQQIGRLLRFGNFLFHAKQIDTKALTERKFRSYWEQTDKTEGNETDRFQAILDIMTGKTKAKPKLVGSKKVLNESHNRRRFTDGNQERKERVDNDDDEEEETEEKMHTTPDNNVSLLRQQRGFKPAFRDYRVPVKPAKGLPPVIKNRFSDGQWHSYQDMATALDVPLEKVKKGALAMKKNGVRYNVRCETKKIGTNEGCILWNLTKSVSLHELTTKLKPLLDRLIDHGKKPWVKQSPSTMLMIAQEIKKQIEEWEAE